jgi:hypothetical protein
MKERVMPTLRNKARRRDAKSFIHFLGEKEASLLSFHF